MGGEEVIILSKLGISKINTNVPTEVTDADMKFLGRYVVLLYSRTLQLTEVNEARQQLFSYGNRKLKSIPHHMQPYVKPSSLPGRPQIGTSFEKQSFSSKSFGVGMEAR